MHKIRDIVSNNLSSRNYEEEKSNDVRRVASSDSISHSSNSHVNQERRVLSQDYIKRSKNPDVRSAITPLRYIQSAKGTWTYNL